MAQPPEKQGFRQWVKNLVAYLLLPVVVAGAFGWAAKAAWDWWRDREKTCEQDRQTIMGEVRQRANAIASLQTSVEAEKLLTEVEVLRSTAKCGSTNEDLERSIKLLERLRDQRKSTELLAKQVKSEPTTKGLKEQLEKQTADADETARRLSERLSLSWSKDKGPVEASSQSIVTVFVTSNRQTDAERTRSHIESLGTKVEVIPIPDPNSHLSRGAFGQPEVVYYRTPKDLPAAERLAAALRYRTVEPFTHPIEGRGSIYIVLR